MSDIRNVTPASIMRNIAHRMGAINLDTKACVYCGCDVQSEEAIASYMQFIGEDCSDDDVDNYVAACPPFMNDSIWWICVLIPPHNMYADVYALCNQCAEEYIANS